MDRFATRKANAAPDVIAPDGCEVRVLCVTARGGMAVFTLAPGRVARAVAHRTVEEIWYVIAGQGRVWRQLDGREEIVEIGPGVSLSIPTGTHFQFRCDGLEPLTILGATMPPWPGADEAYLVDGTWQAMV
jgi:mannose-6-phosphate isomerase-like protein (cupin superfamily)